MASVGTRGVLTFLLLFMATKKAAGDDEGHVKIFKRDVTLTCPGYGDWFRLGSKIDNGSEYTFTYGYSTKGLYFCKWQKVAGDNKVDQYYYFYVQGKVCDNCYEVDGPLFIGVILADILVTTGVMIATYKCTKKKNLQPPPHSAKAPARTTRPAPGSSEYQELSHHTRTGDTYSRMG